MEIFDLKKFKEKLEKYLELEPIEIPIVPVHSGEFKNEQDFAEWQISFKKIKNDFEFAKETNEANEKKRSQLNDELFDMMPFTTIESSSIFELKQGKYKIKFLREYQNKIGWVKTIDFEKQ